MQLTKFSYSEFEGQPREWKLEPLNFGGINLIVGKNASGKSRTINVISGLARLLTGGFKHALNSGTYVACFSEGDDTYEYHLTFKDQEVTREVFSKNQNVLLERSEKGEGRIYAEKARTFLEFQTPQNQLAAVSRRDNLQHHFFEPLHCWAKGVRHFQFGSSLGKNSVALLVKDAPSQIDQWDSEAVIKLFRTGEKSHGVKFKDRILEGMQQLQYDITDIGTGTPSSIIIQAKNKDGVATPAVCIYVKEAALSSNTDQHDMSQGMFRALSIIIQLTYAQLSESPSCVIIDDIGEGLDFERSCALIKLLIQHANNSKLQLIMSTNDRFIMNAVPLSHWKLLHRTNSVCRFYTYENSRDLFDEFRFTGLSNFDFFSGDFLHRKID